MLALAPRNPLFDVRPGLACALALVMLAGACKTTERKPSGKKEVPEQVTKKGEVGKVLKLSSNEPRYLNPVLTTRFNRAVPLIFEGLVGLGKNLEPVPRLAESWKISDDKKTITFRLRKGVKWHDGKPFTAKDVVFTVEALRKQTVPTLWRSYFDRVETIKATDEGLVVVQYKAPYAPSLVTWTMGIIPEHVYGKGELVDAAANREPIGTGPYKLATWDSGKRAVLEANKSWWHGEVGFPTVELRFDIENQVAALKAGDLHFGDIVNIAEWSNEAQEPEFRDKFEVHPEVESKIRVIAWNTQKKPFSDKRVRQALTRALNRGRVIDDVLLGQAQSISAPYFANMYGADRSIAPWPFDLDGAAKLLDEAGFPAKEQTRFAVELIGLESLRGPVSDETLAIFRRDLSAIGVELKVRFVSTKEFLDKVVSREFDAAYFGWLPDIPDPDPYSLLHSSQIGVGQNFAGWNNPEADRLLTEARTTLSRDERKVLYQKLHGILHEELPYTPLYAPYGHYAWSREIRGAAAADVGAQTRFPGVAGWRASK